MINIANDEYVIVEIIPTAIDPERGQLVQLSAIKINKLRVVSRFDYRLCDSKILFKKIIDLISYDRDSFTYVDSDDIIRNDFLLWSNNLPILYINNLFTKNYLEYLPNRLESVLGYLGVEYTDDVIDRVIEMYHLSPSNYVVDLLFEALIGHFND